MSVTAPCGFVAAAAACGIKASGAADLALVATAGGAAAVAAGVFTSNRAPAAPVDVSRTHLAATGGHAAAVIVSSGNANAATGGRGRQDARRMCALVGEGLGVPIDEVLVCSTGIIGVPLPMARIVDAIPGLLAGRDGERAAAARAAQAIMTTDTVAKETVVEADGFRVGAMAKGAAMLAPNMATMLAVITTDAQASPPVLASALRAATARTFNDLSVDGCTSTNDTVLALASGHGAAPDADALGDALGETCRRLAEMMAADAEGATKVLRVTVSGAASDADARRAARRVAESLLVKCSCNGEDPYWGRVVSELGSAGVVFDPERVSIAYGGVVVCLDGVAVPHDGDRLRAHMAGGRIELTCDLGVGTGAGGALGTDLGHGYLDENRTTS